MPGGQHVVAVLLQVGAELQQVGAVGLERVARESALELEVGEEVEHQLLERRAAARRAIAMAQRSRRAEAPLYPPPPRNCATSARSAARSRSSARTRASSSPAAPPLDAGSGGRPAGGARPPKGLGPAWRRRGCAVPRRRRPDAERLAEVPARLLLAGTALEADDQPARGERLEQRVELLERREVVQALGSRPQLARRLRAAQHQHGEQRQLRRRRATAPRRADGGTSSRGCRAAREARPAAAHEPGDRLADRLLVVVDDRLAAGRLVGREAQRVQRQRVGVGRRALLLDQRAEHAQLGGVGLDHCRASPRSAAYDTTRPRAGLRKRGTNGSVSVGGGERRLVFVYHPFCTDDGDCARRRASRPADLAAGHDDARGRADGQAPSASWGRRRCRRHVAPGGGGCRGGGPARRDRPPR